MASFADTLKLLVTADVDGAVRELDKLGTTANRTGKNTGRDLDAIGATMTRMGATMLAGGALAAAGLYKAGQSASDLNEAVNVTNEVFGAGADEIKSFAKNAATGLGQSERAANEAAAQFGLLLQNMGFAQDETVSWSKDLTTLSSDLASFFNASPEETVLALGSALRGESEPIRRFGVFLDEAAVKAKAVELGLASAEGEVSNYAKTQGRLALIMEQTSQAQGDFARTSDGVANQQRILAAQFEDFKAQLGQAVLPVMQEITGTLGGMLEGFNKLDPATQNAISTIAVLTTGLVLAGGAINTIVGTVITFRKNLILLKGALIANAGPLAAIAAAVGTAVFIWNKWNEASERAKALTDDLVSSIQEQQDTVKGTEDVVREMLQTNADFAGGIEAAGMTVGELADKLATTSEEDMPAFIQQLADAANEGGATRDEFQELLLRTGELGGAVREAESHLADLEATQGTTGAAADELETDLAELETQTDDTKVSVQEFESAWRELAEEFVSRESSLVDARVLLEDIRRESEQLRDENGELISSNAENEQSFITMSTEIAGAAGKMADAGASAGELEYFMLLARGELNNFADSAGISRDRVNELDGALDAIDNRVVRVTIDQFFRQSGAPSPAAAGITGSVGAAFQSASPTSGGSLAGVSNPDAFKAYVAVNIDGRQVAEAVADAGRYSGGTIR